MTLRHLNIIPFSSPEHGGAALLYRPYADEADMAALLKLAKARDSADKGSRA